VLVKYHAILSALHWQNATVDTAPRWQPTEGGGARLGRHSDGGAVQLATAELLVFRALRRRPRDRPPNKVDNEQIPPFASLKKFIPPDKLWPINDAWYFHAGSNPKNGELTRFGARSTALRLSGSAEEFGAKAQLAHYEVDPCPVRGVRAGGWTTTR